jgi:hypothetical protein
MSKSRLEKIFKKTLISEGEKARRKREAEAATKREKALAKGIQTTAGLSVSIASGVAAVSAAGASASAGTFLTAAAVAAPPFSTIAAGIAGAGLAVGLAIKGSGDKRKQYLSKDSKLLSKLISDYKKKGTSWRKKEITKLLKKYDKHLDKGNKKTLSLLDGNKRNKQELGWRAKKAEYEMKLRALYASQYADSYNKHLKGTAKKPKITKKQAEAERRVIKRIKTKQRNSIDPRTSMIKLWKPGQIVATPKMLAADALQMRKPDTSIIKLAKMAETNPQVYQVAPKLNQQIQQTNKQAIAFMATPTKDMPKPIQKAIRKEEAIIAGTKKPILIGSAIGASALILWTSFLLGSKKNDNG